MLKCLVSLALMVFLGAAQAQINSAPALKEGDSWEYRFQNSRDRSQDGTFTLTVRSVTPEGYGVGYASSRGRQSTFGMTLGLNPTVRANPNAPRMERKWVSWPLQVGNSWKYAYVSGGGSGNVRYEMEAKVEAVEEVTVPAGKFEAYRIKTSGSYVRESDNRGGRVEEVIWFAPAVKQRVKYQFQQTDIRGALYDDTLIELLKYLSNP